MCEECEAHLKATREEAPVQEVPTEAETLQYVVNEEDSEEVHGLLQSEEPLS